jgi:large subunit ribosomal protein L25
MDIAQLKVEMREGRGSAESRRIRKAGKLPAILYGHGQEPETLTVGLRDLKNLLEHKTHVLELVTSAGKQQALIKDVQFDYLGSTPVHVDFARVSLTERVKVSVPLDFRGTPAGVTEGGIFDSSRVDLEVECLVTEIPESIRVMVADLKIGDFLHVKDMVVPEGVKVMAPADTIICTVRAKAEEEAVVAAVEGEAGAAEPEIIGRKEKAAEEEEAESK